MTVKGEILRSVGKRFNLGESFRMRHNKKLDGTVCTKPEDDPALVVTRVADGLIYICHRCHCQGKVPDMSLGPKDTKARLEALKRVPINKVVEKVDIPYDFQQMTDRNATDTIPFEAYAWLWKYGLKEEDFRKYGIGWSKVYDRVILPIYEFAEMGDSIAKKLVGWVGRDIKVLSKQQRKDKGIPKYRTRSKKGKRRYFMTIGDRDKVVICEDILSAIKVNQATGYTTIALLNATVGDDLMRWLRGRVVYLWLDADMLAESVKRVNRMRQLAIDARHVHTPKDPKEYASLFIQDTLARKEWGE